jgi:hypothetical protein
MGAWLPRIGLPGELNVHGLRKLAAASLADAGCSTHEIAAIIRLTEKGNDGFRRRANADEPDR